METKFVGSNPSHGKVVFHLAVFFFFLIHLNFLPHASIQSVVCLMRSLFEAQHYCGINSQQWKKAIEINLSLQEEISMKKYQQRHLWGETTDTSGMFGANKKIFF